MSFDLPEIPPTIRIGSSQVMGLSNQVLSCDAVLAMKFLLMALSRHLIGNIVIPYPC